MNSHSRTEAGRKLEEYWRSIRGNHERIPTRAAFKVTSESAAFLPFLVLSEVVGSDLVFRLSGTGVTEHQGIDIAGKSYGDFSEPDQVARAVARVRAFHAQPCGFVSVHREEYKRGTASVVELVGFPLLASEAGGLMMAMVLTPIGFDLVRTPPARPIIMTPASRIDFIDVGYGVPDGAAIVAGIATKDQSGARSAG